MSIPSVLPQGRLGRLIPGIRLSISCPPDITFPELSLTVFKNLPNPPVAAKKPISDTRHGITRTDDYAWLRADNWQAMFKDPAILDPAIRQHLEAENVT